MNISLDDFLKHSGTELTIMRNETVVSALTGLFNTEKTTKRKYIGFKPGSDIMVNDVVLTSANEKFYITDTFTQYTGQEQFQIKAYYQTEAEHNSVKNQTSNTVFNIGSVSNSVVGNNNITTFNQQQIISDMKSASETSEDKDELQQIISLLEMILEEKITPKKGLLSSFGDTLSKHSWFTSHVASALISWLTSQGA